VARHREQVDPDGRDGHAEGAVRLRRLEVVHDERDARPQLFRLPDGELLGNLGTMSGD
jgi:hypothetical protein